MSAPSAMTPMSDRLLTFEVADVLYGIPISGVLEVAETDHLTCIPTLPAGKAGVMNWHGDVLPVFDPGLLLSLAETGAEPANLRASARAQVLVLSDRGGSTPRLGLPVDRVLGLVDGMKIPDRPSRELVVERRQQDGRVMTVVDPRRLVAWAGEVIERLAA